MLCYFFSVGSPEKIEKAEGRNGNNGEIVWVNSGREIIN